MNVKAYGLRSFIVEDGIIRIFCHIEIGDDKKLIIDRIDLNGSVEILELRTLFRKIHRYFKEIYKVF